ncbi:MAG: polyprenyl synthetase family protein [Deltaproteobacteria bacterium]|jgi:geranylgeranyl pyrophosphate synthase|nr:polyprenyl synthetase family protein [Deltaproteobacteria bacterium]
MPDSKLQKWFISASSLINEALEECLARPLAEKSPEIDRLIEAMKYSLLGRGKRYRPLLLLAAAEAMGEKEKTVLPAALAVEMIHAYSLIHDDLPALDNDDMRRGRPTLHLAFDEATAILAGDALQSLAFQTLAQMGERNPAWKDRVSTSIFMLARAIGPFGMVGGQAEDLAFEKKTPDIVRILSMERKKTGELMAASLGIGAALAGADKRTAGRFRQIGLFAGQAFQIQDDVLNQTGDPGQLGKAVGSDAERGKTTAPAAIGLDEADKLAFHFLTQAEKIAVRYSPEKLPWLLKVMIQRSN